ncbi:MAG: dihydrofolate reductase family protein [Chitinophagaceae bacterium]
MGARTYNLAFELSKSYGWAYGDTPTIVLTNRELPVDRSTVKFYSGDLNEFAEKQLKGKFKSVWVVGGASLAKDFLHAKLVNEIRVSVMPIILGDGLLLFDHIGLEQKLHLKDVNAYRSGVVEMVYEVAK